MVPQHKTKSGEHLATHSFQTLPNAFITKNWPILSFFLIDGQKQEGLSKREQYLETPTKTPTKPVTLFRADEKITSANKKTKTASTNSLPFLILKKIQRRIALRKQRLQQLAEEREQIRKLSNSPTLLYDHNKNNDVEQSQSVRRQRSLSFGETESVNASLLTPSPMRSPISRNAELSILHNEIEKEATPNEIKDKESQLNQKLTEVEVLKARLIVKSKELQNKEEQIQEMKAQLELKLQQMNTLNTTGFFFCFFFRLTFFKKNRVTCVMTYTELEKLKGMLEKREESCLKFEQELNRRETELTGMMARFDEGLSLHIIVNIIRKTEILYVFVYIIEIEQKTHVIQDKEKDLEKQANILEQKQSQLERWEVRLRKLEQTLQDKTEELIQREDKIKNLFESFDGVQSPPQPSPASKHFEF
ncbi:viral A-type inclusion protein [Reticulomyxa filosa]|uniref:Viral A-type inclusion protein n=1 Tax=Reticulomyxa filosa TaxID=46433 RepID=X6MAF5_RETFI|nr:viral A-type inclusion protein [Reticulomyxa filosa]|eukprot:ETO10010.1 viral A-type inclusion protein [Reticulomyxa filosa]